jgi:hypothetical protein
MKLIRFLLLLQLICLSACSQSKVRESNEIHGPVNADANGLVLGDFSEAKQNVLNKEVDRIFESVFALRKPEGLKRSNAPSGWYNKNGELCQIRVDAQLSRKEFWSSFKAKDWKEISTPKWYIEAMHIDANVLQCFEGTINDMPAHVLWLDSAEALFIIVELKRG